MSNTEKYPRITKPVNNCLRCGTSIIDHDKHPSMLVESNDEIIRKDYCEKCWEEVQKDEMYSFWLAKRFKPPEDKRVIRRTRNENLLNMFYTFVDKGGDEYKFHLYIIAHLLMKYKVFTWQEQSVDDKGDDVLLFKNTQADETVSVRDVDEEDEMLVTVKGEIDALLEGHLPDSQPEEEPTDPTAIEETPTEEGTGDQQSPL